MKIEDFGKKIKLKYPQYQDMPDAELGQKMIAKYPEYKDLIDVAEPAQVSKLQKASNIVSKIFPGKKVGEAIGTLAGLGISKVQGTSEFYDTSVPSPKQVIGDVVAGASQVAGVKGVGTSGGLIKRALGSAGIGAGLFGGGAMAEDKSIKEITKSAAVGAGVGAGTSVALSGVEAIAKQLRELPERLIRSATGQSKKEILAGKWLEKFVLENKRVGTADKLIRDSKENMEKLSNLINKNLQSVPVTQAKITTSSILDDIVKNVNSQGGAISKAEARDIVERLAPQAKCILAKPSMSLVTANKLRQSIDRTIGDKGFLVSELPFNKDILRSFANALREGVKSKAPEGTRGAFSSLANEIRLSNALTNKVAQGSRNQVISFGDLIGGGIGGAAGGVPGIFVGAAARRAVQSTPFLSGSAVAIDTLDRTLTPILSQLEPTVQTAILTAIQEALQSQATDQK